MSKRLPSNAGMVLVAGMLLVGCAPSDEGAEAATVATEMMEQGTMGQRAGPVAPPTTDAEMIASALSAAPPAVTRDARVVALGDDGQLRTIREGSGPFTCIPDGPSPGVDPMCLDPNALTWVNAWIAREPPPEGLIGFAYMLAGGSDASSVDPFATEPAQGEDWVDTGPHVMVLGGDFRGHPTTHDDTSRPYVMYPGTPYAHLMAPVR